MDKIVILAGSGSLPVEIYNLCLAKDNISPHVIGLRNYFDDRQSQIDSQLLNVIPVHKISLILDRIRKIGAKKIIIAGGVSRKEVPKLIFDIKGRELIGKIAKNGLSDKSIFQTAIEFLEKEGLEVISYEQLFPSLQASDAHLTRLKPQPQDIESIEYGSNILNTISHLDIGQGLIVQNKMVLGIEAAEGTDELIRRCKNLQQRGADAILVKMHKVSQDKRIDSPCVGPQTLKTMYENNIAGLAIGRGTIILDRAETIKLADNMKKFIHVLY